MQPQQLSVIDLFCGGGGTSQGLQTAAVETGNAIGVLAVNHNAQAIETYDANHPGADARCARVEAVHMKELYRQRRVHLVWGSPECTNHSQAKGDLSLDDQSRSTAMAVLDVVSDVRPDVVYVENVRGFRNWGPLELVQHKGRPTWRPVKARVGETFEAWLAMLRALGYSVEHRLVVAADYGDPTSRERLIVQAVLPHVRMEWPEATHGSPDDPDVLSGRKLPWLTAASVIDWSNLGNSIFSRKKPLARNTVRRIISGLSRSRGRQGSHALGSCMLTLRGTSDRALDRTGTSVDQPVPTITAGGAHHMLVSAVVVPQQSDGQGRPPDMPIPTIATAGAIGLAQVTIQRASGPRRDETAFRIFGDVDVDDGGRPLLTDEQYRQFVAGVSSFLVKYYGTGIDASVDRPLDTVTTRSRFALVNVVSRPVMVADSGLRWSVDILYRMFTVRELAAATGFPPNYWFAGTQETQIRQIGNAVPVNMARALGASAFRRIRAASLPDGS